MNIELFTKFLDIFEAYKDIEDDNQVILAIGKQIFQLNELQIKYIEDLHELIGPTNSHKERQQKLLTRLREFVATGGKIPAEPGGAT
jgi:hypothetical protein